MTTTTRDRMAADLELAAVNLARQTDHVATLVCEAYRLGMSYRSIAVAVGMSHTNVARIVKAGMPGDG